MGRHLSLRYGQVYWSADTRFWQLSIDHNIDVQYVCILVLESMRLNIDCDLVKQLTGQRTASKKHATSMNWHMSPPYGHVILVSGYPVLAAVNWPFCECPNTRCGQSVVGSGNSTFCKKRGFTKWKTPRNQDLHLYSILNTEKRKPFFNFQSPLWKLEKSAPFSHEKPDIFRICLRYKVM